ncbi:hypothetical protein HY636_04870 [Candidatus Woesearchaeota archaeon]|nr:hypothetical protein [Candidatus Woesearchaeota archaeon]
MGEDKDKSQTLYDKVKTDERLRGSHAWNTCDGGVRGLVYSPERIRELAGKKHKNYWKIGALVGGIAVFTAVATTSILLLKSANEREGWSRIEPPVEQISNIEQYKGKVIEGITLREVKEKINSVLESFCERGYIGNGEGLFCDTGITPSLNNLLDVVGIINNDSVSSSSVTLTFDERVIKYDESVQGKAIIVGGKDDYTLTDFSQHVLDNEHNFVWWIKKEYNVKIDYGKLKDLALVMAFPPIAVQKTETGGEYQLIDTNALPKVIFRLVYNDGSKQDIKLDKTVGSCMSKEELIVQCKKYNIEIEYCEEDYWKSFTRLEEMACRLEKKIRRDMNKHGDTGYELELVRWTTERIEHVFTGKTTLAEKERIDAIRNLADLLRTYLYQDIVSMKGTILIDEIKRSTNEPRIVTTLYKIAHSRLDALNDSEREKERDVVDKVLEHVAEVLKYLPDTALEEADANFCLKLRNQGNLEYLTIMIFNVLEKVISCLTKEHYEKEAITEVYKTLEIYAENPVLTYILSALYEKACSDDPQKNKVDETVKIAMALRTKKVVSDLADCCYGNMGVTLTHDGYTIPDLFLESIGEGKYKLIIDEDKPYGFSDYPKVFNVHPDIKVRE